MTPGPEPAGPGLGHPLPEDETVWTGPRPTGLIGPASARPTLGYRALRLLLGFVGRRVFGFRIVVRGAENLPRGADGRPSGGWIVLGLPHRTWIEPFVVADVLPAEPRPVFFGDGRAIFRGPIRRFAARRIGGVIPIWKPGAAERPDRENPVETYLDAVRQVIEAGAILVIFGEIGPPVPIDRARPLGRGVAYFALRTGAPIVPIVLGGTHELFRGRRIAVRVLPPATGRELAGLGTNDPLPEPWSGAERRAARRIVAELSARTAGPITETFRQAEPPPGSTKRWLRLTHLWR